PLHYAGGFHLQLIHSLAPTMSVERNEILCSRGRRNSPEEISGRLRLPLQKVFYGFLLLM
ncbi:MAG: hypothetical protein N3B10_15705, partial [Armatimonadetes bacterium]|nr:hypothetical protein [Armatimonadota bacterium]